MFIASICLSISPNERSSSPRRGEKEVSLEIKIMYHLLSQFSAYSSV